MTRIRRASAARISTSEKKETEILTPFSRKKVFRIWVAAASKHFWVPPALLALVFSFGGAKNPDPPTPKSLTGMIGI